MPRPERTTGDHARMAGRRKIVELEVRAALNCDFARRLFVRQFVRGGVRCRRRKSLADQHLDHGETFVSVDSPRVILRPDLRDWIASDDGPALRDARAHGRHQPAVSCSVADRLATKEFDRATIYRNLVELAEAGLVNRIELGDHVWRFSYGGPARIGRDCDGAQSRASALRLRRLRRSFVPPDRHVSIKHPGGAKPEMISDVTEVLLKGHCGNCA